MLTKENLTYKNLTFDAEREFYGVDGAVLDSCIFAGPQDGESAFKEARNIEARGCRFELRYPFWHNSGSLISSCELTSTCRAPFWYSERQRIEKCRILGTKAIRECRDISVLDSSVASDEFGWSTERLTMAGCDIEGFYFAMRASDVTLSDVRLSGKYSLQYVENGVIENCILDTKDSLWHAKNVTVKNSTVRGEYLAWYSENITFENCVISGTQPFCYCKGLRLLNCELQDCDLAFEKSEVYAEITTPVISIKNPAEGIISVPSVGELIRTDPHSLCEVRVGVV